MQVVHIKSPHHHHTHTHCALAPVQVVHTERTAAVSAVEAEMSAVKQERVESAASMQVLQEQLTLALQALSEKAAEYTAMQVRGRGGGRWGSWPWTLPEPRSLTQLAVASKP